ncbi:2Fe-2S iron-sulfur cluster-binding domain protein [Necator americanus]|uniref:2Fe-2S iron-sulfur cluster-binding domain protein n=1 Tax=Necator americanus TaxID=51031 RepID=W2SM35_NECAM|nr:2Fe-2S iron-sulfur cluster-binding domain protein [Necator americanus]ETN70695.1 2Fe-2S iron-sulfur cluster-binding domain protein [Necator americanus]
MDCTTIHFNVNGKYVEVENVDPEMTLAYFLRNELGLTGTKLGCEEGACGACTVTIGKWDPTLRKARYIAINACLFPLYMSHQRLILTVEGIGSTKKLHPIQERIARGHGTQCGFCSPGFVMSAYALLRNNPNPSIHEINQSIKGNLCRCTGYRPIVEALQSFSQSGCCNGTANGGNCPCKENRNGMDREKLVTFDDFPKFDESQEIVFPPLFIIDTQNTDIILKGPRVEMYAPSDFEKFEHYLQANSEARIVSSGLITRLTIPVSCDSVKWLSTHRLNTLDHILEFDEEILLGSGLSISEFVDALNKYCDPVISGPIQQLFDKYSSLQVMNLASWVGALCTGASDISSVFLAFNPTVTIRDEKGIHEFRRISDLVDGNGKVMLSTSQFIIADELRVFTFKQGQRLGADSTILNCVAVLHVNEQIESARIAISFGSQAVLCGKLCEQLIGK